MLLPILGTAFFLKLRLKISDSLSILLSISGLTLISYLGGLFGILIFTVYALTVIGTLFLLFEIYQNFKKKTLSFFLSLPLSMFLVLTAIYWLVHAGSKPMLWDEYSHWGIYIREMAFTHEFYKGDSNAAHLDYPPGAPLWQYFFTLLPGYSEGSTFLAQFVFLITPLLVLFENIKLKQWFWVPSILALITLGIANFGQGIVNLSTDHLVSVWYTGVILHVLRTRKKIEEMVLLSFPLAIILLVKDAGILLVASGIFLIICLYLYQNFVNYKGLIFKRNLLLSMITLIVVPLLIHISWKVNRSMEGISSNEEGSGLIWILLTGESKFSAKEIKTYEHNFWEVFSDQQLSRDQFSTEINEFSYDLMPYFNDDFRLTLLGLFILFPVWSGILILITDPKQRVIYTLVLVIIFLTAMISLFIMYRTYTLIHSVERAQNLVSFLRYTHIFILPMFFVGMGMLTPSIQKHSEQTQVSVNFSNYSIMFGITLSLLLTIETPYIKQFYTKSSIENYPDNYAFRWRKYTDKITYKIKEKLGSSKIWIYMPSAEGGIISTNKEGIFEINKNKFQAAVLKYQLIPLKIKMNHENNLIEKHKENLKNIWINFDYLWFPVRDNKFDKELLKFLGRQETSLLKVIKGEKQFDVQAVNINP